jgi:hypothetical protein
MRILLKNKARYRALAFKIKGYDVPEISLYHGKLAEELSARRQEWLVDQKTLESAFPWVKRNPPFKPKAAKS